MPGQVQQPNLALQRIAESLAPPRHKRSTDEVFNEPQRLHKVLASCGFGSRRAMEEMILAGRITVNRMPAEVGQKVGPEDEVRINGELVRVRFAPPRPRILMYHKPAGEIVTRDDPEQRTTVFEKLPSIANGRWINVGRLDYNTEGLLLFTNSGELANRLMHPRYEVEREYAVRVMGRLDDEKTRALTEGIALDDGPARCDSVVDGGGDEEGSNHWYRVVLKEGRNREVRRLFEALGVMVSRLIRTRVGQLAMPTHLKRGDLSELEAAEVTAILAAAGLRDAQASTAPRGHPNGSRRQPAPHGKPGGTRPSQRGAAPGPHRKPASHGPKARGPNRTGPNGTGPNGTGPNGTGPNGTGPNGTGPNARGAYAHRHTPRVNQDPVESHEAAHVAAAAIDGGPLHDARQPGSEPRAWPQSSRRPGSGKPGKPPRARDGFKGQGGGHGGAPRPQGSNRPRVNFDEVQPQSNANALPFGHRTREAGAGPARPFGSGAHGRGFQRPGHGPRPAQRPAQLSAKPRGDVDGNVAPPASRSAIDDDN